MKTTPKHLPVLPVASTKPEGKHQDFRVEVVNGVFVLTALVPAVRPKSTN